MTHDNGRPDDRRDWVLRCGSRYWLGKRELIASLPMPQKEFGDGPPGNLIRISLPEWAADIAVDGHLLAWSGCTTIDATQVPEWMCCDWLSACWYMLSGSVERACEARQGPILSYALRLPVDIRPLFEKAWVNRIFLFLRRWAAQERGQPEEQLFGHRPRATIELTHDVDAIALTPEIRLKQSTFHLANAARSATKGQFAKVASRLGDTARFAFGQWDLRTLERVRKLERAAGLRSVFHFYGGPAGLARRSLQNLLIDPAYDIGSAYLRNELRALDEGGWRIGLHQSFKAWSSARAMREERQRIEDAAGVLVLHCRQHWLRFSWQTTWHAQEAAGLVRDSTLGFNDRPGFRSGHALCFHPWDFSLGAPMQLQAIPMLFMDSHFYDYQSLPVGEVSAEMKRWIDEVRAVGGEVSVNWHTHTITNLYDWTRGFEELLGLLS